MRNDRDKWRHRGEQVRDVTWPLAACGLVEACFCYYNDRLDVLKIMAIVGWICFIIAVLYINQVTKLILDAEEIFHKYNGQQK